MPIATMWKADRCHTDEVYVCGFVPCYLLPNKCPNSLDPFLWPLIEEIKELFIEGIYKLHDKPCTCVVICVINLVYFSHLHNYNMRKIASTWP